MVEPLKRRAILLVFLVIGMAGALIALVWMLMSIIFPPNGDRAWHIAQALDRLGNATTGGDGKETISSRAARLSGQRKWACYLCKFLDWLQKDHCENQLVK